MTVVYAIANRSAIVATIFFFFFFFFLQVYGNLKLNCQLPVMQRAYHYHLPTFFYARRLICDRVPPLFIQSLTHHTPRNYQHSDYPLFYILFCLPQFTHSLYSCLYSYNLEQNHEML